MTQSDVSLIRSDQYRAWVDDENTGHIRVLRRLNFVTLITIIRKICEKQQSLSDKSHVIRIYIPLSLRDISSENLRSFIEFSEICCHMKITIMIADDTAGNFSD
ncbi:MAG TPA: hypothetical protein VN372_11695 [Methanospirillum sp.]|nr:hypothetical protein [Methanospirillum sp.]